MNTSILISVTFLVVFALNFIFGKGISNGWDWISGLAFGLAIDNLARHWEKKNG